MKFTFGFALATVIPQNVLAMDTYMSLRAICETVDEVEMMERLVDNMLDDVKQMKNISGDQETIEEEEEIHFSTNDFEVSSKYAVDTISQPASNIKQSKTLMMVKEEIQSQAIKPESNQINSSEKAPETHHENKQSMEENVILQRSTMVLKIGYILEVLVFLLMIVLSIQVFYFIWRRKTKNEEEEEEQDVMPKLQMFTYFLSFVIGIFYPLLKVALIALANKLVHKAIRKTLLSHDDDDENNTNDNNDLLELIETKLLNSSSSTIISVFLLKPYDFFETLHFTIGIVLLIGFGTSMRNTLQRNYLPYMEVKRLQRILYDKFILEPNTVDMKQAQDIVFTQMSKVEEYHRRIQYIVVEYVTVVIFGLLLFFILSWDIGLMLLGACTVMVFVSKAIYQNMSTPWVEQREKKNARAIARLLDLITCKDVVLSHTMELKEKQVLNTMINEADRQDIRRSSLAKFVAQLIQNQTFTFLMPMLFLYTYMSNFNLEKIFQTLIIMTVLDEMMRSYLALLNLDFFREEYKRAKRAFVVVTGIDEEELFPSPWKRHEKHTSEERKKNEKLDSTVDNLTDQKHDMETQTFMDSSTSTTMIKDELIDLSVNKNLSIEDVTLGYKLEDGSFKTVIDNLNLSFKFGYSYALMGESGAGKSTILKALSGLLPIKKGKTYTDNTVINFMSSSWREQVAVVSQDSLLFNRTLRENLSYGLSNISDEKILTALDKVNLKEMICELPDGLNTVVTHNGNEFSGGQKQRFQIVRVLLSNCPVILLDEMTSALDTKSTRDVIRELKQFIKSNNEKKTLIMITHNSETLSLVDTIIELNRQKNYTTEDTSDKISMMMISETDVNEWMERS